MQLVGVLNCLRLIITWPSLFIQQRFHASRLHENTVTPIHTKLGFPLNSYCALWRLGTRDAAVMTSWVRPGTLKSKCALLCESKGSEWRRLVGGRGESRAVESERARSRSQQTGRSSCQSIMCPPPSMLAALSPGCARPLTFITTTSVCVALHLLQGFKERPVWRCCRIDARPICRGNGGKMMRCSKVPSDFIYFILALVLSSSNWTRTE